MSNMPQFRKAVEKATVTYMDRMGEAYALFQRDMDQAASAFLTEDDMACVPMEPDCAEASGPTSYTGKSRTW